MDVRVLGGREELRRRDADLIIWSQSWDLGQPLYKVVLRREVMDLHASGTIGATSTTSTAR